MSEEQTKVNHIDQVDHAENVISAEHVGLATTLEVHTRNSSDPDRMRSLVALTKNIIVLMALFVMIFNFYDKGRSENRARDERVILQGQVKAAADKLAANDKATADTLNCSRRYQDLVDRSSTDVQISIGELVVIITQIVPGPEREQAVRSKVDELNAANIAARKAVTDKAAYNDAGNPLPCPI